MKYLAFIVWLLFTAIICLLVIPAFFAKETGWFEIGDKILEEYGG
jgi:hypothetical protein